MKRALTTGPVFFLLMFFAVSCSSLNGIQTDADCDRVESENHILKQKQILVERRNSVLEDENIAIRKDVKEKSARVVFLESELKSTKEVHERELKLWQQKYDNLAGKNAILERESGQKIRELSELNRKMEQEFGEKIGHLNEEIKKGESESARMLEDEKKNAAKREYSLSREVEEMKKNVTDRDEKIVRLEDKIRSLNEEIRGLRSDGDGQKRN